MITAVDTNVLLDVMLPDAAHVEQSAGLLRTAYDEGALIISHIVYAELVPQFGTKQAFTEVLSKLGIETSPTDNETAFLAGTKWKAYRQAGGTRQRIISDFIIGSHALLRADRFLTRDRGFYKTYFDELRLLGGKS